jgi:broad specificity phosphatase PhoE
LLTGSWDTKQRVYDDNDPDAKQGQLREPEVDRHSGPINFIDLDCRSSQAASASEDGTVAIVDHYSHKLLGRLNPKDEADLPSVTICKFLKNPEAG